MTILTRILLLWGILIGSITCIHAQASEKLIVPDNSISFQGGPFAWQGTYERQFHTTYNMSINGRFGGGKVYGFDFYGEWAHISAGFLLGKGRQLADMDLGIGIFQIRRYHLQRPYASNPCRIPVSGKSPSF